MTRSNSRTGSQAIDRLIEQLRELAASGSDRRQRARDMAEAIRAAGKYRWVGLYDVTATRIAAIGWSGPQAPAHPVFPVSQGLSGAAVAAGEPLIVQDVSFDARYLATLPGSRAEAIFPVIVDGAVVGTIDVESDRANAFTAEDERLLRACAAGIDALWVDDVIDEI